MSDTLKSDNIDLWAKILGDCVREMDPKIRGRFMHHIGWRRTGMLSVPLRIRLEGISTKLKKDYVALLIDQTNGDSKQFWPVLGDSFLKTKSASINCIYTKNTTDIIYGIEAANEIN